MLRGMRASRVWLACLLLLATTGCSGRGGDPDEPAAPSSSSAPAGMDESLRDAAVDLVAAREQALVDGDRDAFLATIDPDAKDFRTSQARWWDNLARLPVTDLALELGDEDVMSRISGAGDLQLPVDFTMRLKGFDEHPVTQPMVYTFVGDEDEVHLSTDRNVQIEAMTDWTPAPWDVTAIEVVQTDRVLGVFDAETIDQGEEVVATAEDALEALDDAGVPDWTRTVTLYDITDLDALDAMSLMEVEGTGGVAFPVPARPGRRTLAAYRMVLNPATTATDDGRTFILRHELTHVALGDRDDRSPGWLVEGAAEYMSVRSYDVAVRRVAWARALADVDSPALRLGRDFYQVDPAGSYATAGLVCDYLASVRGEAAIWELMAAFDRRRAVSEGDVDRVLEREIGVDAAGLLDQALTWLNG